MVFVETKRRIVSIYIGLQSPVFMTLPVSCVSHSDPKLKRSSGRLTPPDPVHCPDMQPGNAIFSPRLPVRRSFQPVAWLLASVLTRQTYKQNNYDKLQTNKKLNLTKTNPGFVYVVLYSK